MKKTAGDLNSRHQPKVLLRNKLVLVYSISRFWISAWARPISTMDASDYLARTSAGVPKDSLIDEILGIDVCNLSQDSQHGCHHEINGWMACLQSLTHRRRGLAVALMLVPGLVAPQETYRPTNGLIRVDYFCFRERRGRHPLPRRDYGHTYGSKHKALRNFHPATAFDSDGALGNSPGAFFSSSASFPIVQKAGQLAVSSPFESGWLGSLNDKIGNSTLKISGAPAQL